MYEYSILVIILRSYLSIELYKLVPKIVRNYNIFEDRDYRTVLGKAEK